MTITESLAEIKTIAKRISSKRDFIKQYLIRMENVKDPLEKDGGSVKAISEAMQSIRDLEDRVVELRRRIQMANESTHVEIDGVDRSVADWLVWRRDVSPGRTNFLHNLRLALTSVRDQARRQGSSLFGPGTVAEKSNDIIVHINETELAAESEKLENILGQLDGQLSLKNATVMVQ